MQSPWHLYFSALLSSSCHGGRPELMKSLLKGRQRERRKASGLRFLSAFPARAPTPLLISCSIFFRDQRETSKQMEFNLPTFSVASLCVFFIIKDSCNPNSLPVGFSSAVPLPGNPQRFYFSTHPRPQREWGESKRSVWHFLLMTELSSR